jgi:hypothetical protein
MKSLVRGGRIRRIAAYRVVPLAEPHPASQAMSADEKLNRRKQRSGAATTKGLVFLLFNPVFFVTFGVL